MAFKTRSGRTAAVGRGAMIVGMALWWVVLAEIVLAALAVGAGAWGDWAAGESLADGDYFFLLAVETATSLVTLALALHLVAVGWTLPVFVGPKSRIRDFVAAGVRSRTGWWFLSSAALLGSLRIALSWPASDAQLLVMIGLLVAWIAVWIIVLRGLRMIAHADRQQAYFEGMTESEKQVADNPWPSLATPGYLDVDRLESAEDADRYAHRAADTARVHDWLGGGVMVLATALLGAAVSRFFETSESAPWVWVAVSLLAVAFGYAVQRRGRAYHRLRESYEKASAELTARENARPTTWRGRFAQSMRVLLGG